MPTNKTVPTTYSVNEYIRTLSKNRQVEARQLIHLMQSITHKAPVLWGTSIIGFGVKEYTYESGRKGEIPVLSFSPRKNAITIYINEGFDRYSDELNQLGNHKTSISCLYISNLEGANLDVLNKILTKSYALSSNLKAAIKTVDEYIKTIPIAARPLFDELRKIVLKTLPYATEVVSYGIIGYKIDNKRPRVFISGWKDHIAMYPIPKNANIQNELAPYIKGKGTLWFPLQQKLPKTSIIKAVRALTM